MARVVPSTVALLRRGGLACAFFSLAAPLAAVVPSLHHPAFTGGGGRISSGSYALDVSVPFLAGPTATATTYALRPGLAGQLNDAPVAGADTIARHRSGSVEILLSVLLGNDADLEHDAMSVVAVSTNSAAGGVVRLEASRVVYDPPTSNPATDTFTYVITDGYGTVGVGTVTVNVLAATVVGRRIFYDSSSWDTVSDDNAIATDKAALLPGGTATFANYTSYSRGINGIMVDILDLPPGPGPAEVDFAFRTGNNGTVSGWVTAPAPKVPGGVTLRRGSGTGGSDRVTLIWSADAVKKKWLQVRVKATSATGLAADDVFYFGNAIGEAGNQPGVNALVNATDEILARNNPRGTFSPAPITFPYDFNRDKLVNATDQILSRLNGTSAFSALVMLRPPTTSAALAGPRGSARERSDVGVDDVEPGTSGDASFGIVSLSDGNLVVYARGNDGGTVRLERKISSGPWEPAPFESSSLDADGVFWWVGAGDTAGGNFFRLVRP